MKFKWDKRYLYKGITAFLVIVSSISFFLLLYKIEEVYGVVVRVVDILMPFIVGFVIAYLLCPVMTFIEGKIVKKILLKTRLKNSKKIPRNISIIITVLIALTIVTSLFCMVIPELVQSIESLVNNSSTYVSNFQKWINSTISSNESISNMLTEEVTDMGTFIVEWAKNSLLPQFNSIVSNVTSGVIGAVIFLKNIFIGLIISIYLLASKEKFSAQAKKLLYSILSVKTTNKAMSIMRRSHKVFGGFITGKLLDSLIIGIICFIGMSIFNMPYAMLISVIIGVTNVIPFFGPFIGAIPSALLILMIDPLTCLYFVIFVLVLQQFDGNILGPMILGDSTGLSAFWVIFAILISGGLFGFVGMVIGVPAFAVIYSLIVEFVNNRLKNREMPVSTSVYEDAEYINAESKQVIYDEDFDVKIFEPTHKDGTQEVEVKPRRFIPRKRKK